MILAGCSEVPELADLQGHPLTLKQDDHSWLVVNYWATWCDPCREEIPELNSLSAAKNDIRVWGVDFDSVSPATSLKELTGKVEQMGIAFPVVSPATVVNLGISLPSVLPATYILDTRGQLKKQLFGPQTQFALEQHVSELKREQEKSG